MKKAPKDIDTYLLDFSEEIQKKLDLIRTTIRKASPDSVECIAYSVPAFRYRGKLLVLFGAYQKHIGFYATPSGNEAFDKELSVYPQGKGSVQFPYDQEIPFDLIARIAQFREGEIAAKAKKK